MKLKLKVFAVLLAVAAATQVLAKTFDPKPAATQKTLEEAELRVRTMLHQKSKIRQSGGNLSKDEMSQLRTAIDQYAQELEAEEANTASAAEGTGPGV